ncbi:MAG: hypothetical protein II995_01150 [Oscillospiraceae bacterium]|nr:hypothetical protein [Oscillospiraceae bacterium]
MGKPPYSDSYSTGKNKDRIAVIKGLKGIVSDIKRDLQNGIRNNDYIKDENAKNLIEAIKALDDCGIRCDCKEYIKELSWYVGGDSRKIRDLQKNLNELRINSGYRSLEEDGVYGKETLSAWLKFLDILEHGTVPTLAWIDPLEGHDIKFIIESSRHGHSNVIADIDKFQYYRVDSAHGGAGWFRGERINNVDFNHLNINYPAPMSELQKWVKNNYDHYPLSDSAYELLNDLKGTGKAVRISGKVLLVTGIALDTLELGLSIADDLKDEDRKLGKKAATTAFSIGGRWSGAAIGAKAGAIAGGFAGPFAPFAIPVLSLAGGIAGSFGGDALGKWVVDITCIEE